MRSARYIVRRISFILTLASLGALAIGLAVEIIFHEVIFGEGYRSGFYSWALLFTAVHFFSWSLAARKAAGRKRYIMPVAVILPLVLLFLGLELWETARHLLPVLALAPIMAAYLLWPRQSTEKANQEQGLSVKGVEGLRQDKGEDIHASTTSALKKVRGDSAPEESKQE